MSLEGDGQLSADEGDDFNGNGFWSVDEVLKRYADYARLFGITQPIELTPLMHSTGDRNWIYPVMDHVIEGIEAGASH